MNHLHLLIDLKLALFRNDFQKLRKRSNFEFFTLILFLLAAATGLFFFFFQSFRFFKEQEPFGPILIDETFYLFNFVLFLMLLISSAISAYASLFRSGEVPFLLSHPLRWSEIYFIKVTEAIWFSSWSFLFIAVPFMMAFGLNKNLDWTIIPFFCFIFYFPFVLFAGILGTLAGVLTVWLLPNRKRRRLALVSVILIAVMFFIKTGPEVIKEQGSLAGILSGYLPHVTFAKHPLLPSYWTTRGILALTSSPETIFSWGDGNFYLLVLISNTLFFLIPSYSVACGLYPKTYFNAQDLGEYQAKRQFRIHRGVEKWLDSFVWPSRPAMAFLEKDIKTFSRDPSEWSQLIIFFGLLLIYFLNLKNLEFHVLKDFWKNLVFILNTVGTYIVLSSFSMRFIYPMLSLEGARAWIIGVAPIRLSSPLLEKFLLGTLISLLLTMPLVFLSGWLLEIPLKRVLFMTGLGFFVCVALTGMSVGFGARFPNFKSTNPSEIISGFGGSMLLMAHLGYLAFIGIFLILSREPHWLVFWTMAAISLLVATVPLKVGINALKRMEF